MRNRIIILLGIVLLAAGCKSPSINCRYNLTVTWQERKAVKEPIPLTTARVYAFFVDPNDWEVTSIDDARNGIISQVSNPANRQSYDAVGVASGEYGNQFAFDFQSEPVMLVVADEKYPMWATGNANVVPDLPSMLVTLNFTPLDKPSAEPSVKGPWKFYGYSDVVIPIDTDIEILPVVTRRGQYASEILVGAGAYAFYGLEKGKASVGSWSDASQGVAHRQLADATEQSEPVHYTIAAEHRGDSLSMRVADEKVMVVVYNQPSFDNNVRMYAYGFFDLADNPITKSNTLLFDLNKISESWTSDIWTISVEYPSDDAVQEPDQDPETELVSYLEPAAHKTHNNAKQE